MLKLTLGGESKSQPQELDWNIPFPVFEFRSYLLYDSINLGHMVSESSQTSQNTFKTLVYMSAFIESSHRNRPDVHTCIQNVHWSVNFKPVLRISCFRFSPEKVSRGVQMVIKSNSVMLKLLNLLK